MKHTNGRILLFQSDPDEAQFFSRLLSGSPDGPLVECAPTLREGIERLSQEPFDLILLDPILSDARGLETFTNVRGAAPRVPVVIIRGAGAAEDGLEDVLIRAGAQDYFLRDRLDEKHFLRFVRHMMESHTARSDQEQAANELEFRVQFEKLVTETASRFISLSFEEIDAGISQALEDIGKFLGADRAYVFQFSEDCSRFKNTYEVCAPGIESHIQRLQSLPVEVYSWFIQKIKNMDTVYVPDVSRLPAEAASEKQEFELEGIRSIVCVPLIFEAKSVGFIGFDWVSVRKEWSESFRGFLRIVGEMFVNALEHKKVHEKMDHMIFYDSLTDLPNRPIFIDRLNQAIVRAKHDRHLTAILHLDLDQFKRVNETFGRVVGDKLLLEVVKRLRHTLFETDTVARVGVDEFVVLLQKIHQQDDLLEVANKIFNVFKTPFTVEGHQLHMTCSIGSGCYPHDGEHPEELLKNVDAAKCHAKQHGRNTYKRYSNIMNARALERLVLENHLRYAIDHGELCVFYQPQVDIRSGEIIGLEALVRWEHPEWGLVPPMDFIPLAEETGLIVPLGEWVLRQACQQSRNWQSEGIRPVRIAVNLSLEQFRDGNLLDMVTRVLAETGMRGEDLEFELTESMIVKNVEEAAELLNAFKKMGVRISLDDFGAGQSSLGYLKRLPIDTLKIDRMFVRDIPADAENAAIARAIISMAQSLKLEVIAEGIETEAQLQFFRDNQCYRIQGFLFSKPVTADICKQFLNDRGFSHCAGVFQA